MSAQPEDRRREIRDINAMIRALVEQETLEYPFWVGGIVTRIYTSEYGHVYFDLKDGDFTISCMIREQVRGTLPNPLANGMDVEVFGSIRVYERAARVQVEVEQVKFISGEKPLTDNAVLKELEAKGLWPKTPKTLPNDIKRIGLVTSRHSKAIDDFKETFRQGQGKADIVPVDVRLQSAKDIAEAIDRLSREDKVDVIAVVRGGGRTDELAVFNDLDIATAICQSKLPIITGIGHESDNTLADYLADIRTITPQPQHRTY